MAAIAERAPRFRARSVFYSGIAAAIAVAVFFGFAHTFFLRGYVSLPTGFGPLSPLLLLHGVVATAWIGVFCLQTSLVAIGRTDLHRRLGVAGAGVAAAMFIVGAVVAIAAMRHHVEPFGIDRRVWFMGVTFPGILAFGSLVLAAVALRRRSEAHKRLMLLATITLLAPAGGRLLAHNFDDVTLSGFLFANFALPDVFVVAAVVYELWSRRRVHPALVLGGGALLLLPVLVVAAGTPTGLALAELFL